MCVWVCVCVCVRPCAYMFVWSGDSRICSTVDPTQSQSQTPGCRQECLGDELQISIRPLLMNWKWSVGHGVEHRPVEHRQVEHRPMQLRPKQTEPLDFQSTKLNATGRWWIGWWVVVSEMYAVSLCVMTVVLVPLAIHHLDSVTLFWRSAYSCHHS